MLPSFLSFNETWFNFQPRDPLGFTGCFTPFPDCCHAQLCRTRPQMVKVTPDEGAHDRSARMWWQGRFIFNPKNGRFCANRSPTVATSYFRTQRWDITQEELKILISRLGFPCAHSQLQHQRRSVGALWRKRRDLLCTPPSLSWRVFCEMKEL